MSSTILPTWIISTFREALHDMVKEKWGVDGYGSMKGLIISLDLENEIETEHDEEDDNDANGSSESNVEEHEIRP